MSSDRQTDRRTPTRVTLRDVAERAGVSASTASLVFSGRGPVAPPTAQRVRDAAAALGYTGPDPIASSLRHGRAGVVGVSVEGPLRYAFSDPYAVSVLDGMAQVLGEAGVGMLLLAHEPGAADAERAQLSGHALDALVLPLCGPRTSPAVGLLEARGIPVVAAGAPYDPGVTRVEVDDRGGSADAVHHLLKLGHRRIGHVLMPLHPGASTQVVTGGAVARATYPDAAARADGFTATMGRRLVPDLLVQAAWSSVADGAAAAGLLLDRAQPPTAVVAQSDLLAVGVLRAAQDRGLRVPEDLSVVGFDGIDMPWFPGRLTTVEQPGAQKGRRLAELALARIDGAPASVEVMPVSLRVGSTSAPPP